MAAAEKVEPDARCCVNCDYWRRHYIRIENSVKGFWPLENGHCANPEKRRPRTKPSDKCEQFKKGDESDAGGEEAEAQFP